MIFDTHAHLDDPRFDEDRELVIEKLKREDIALVLNPGADMDSSKRSVELAKKYDFIYASVGFHPHDVKDMKEEDLETLKQMAQEEKVLAIGEIGLDFYYDNSPRETQKEWFIKQIKLANELKLPIIIHSRDAAIETMDIIKEYKSDEIGCLLHCYSGSLEHALEYVKMGCYISIAGPVTFKNNKKTPEVVKALPLDRILIETDSPYMAPEPFRGRRNDPSLVKYVLKTIAKLKDVSEEEMEKITFENGKRFFGIA